MCGLAGFIWVDKIGSTFSSQLNAMLKPIYHRGPDDSGTWCDDQYGVGLGHRRLSILELTSAGRQPMESVCGKYVIVFNGEIYNYLELRKTLEKQNHLPANGWRGHSDTETLLACFSAWGIKKTLQACVGMFALAIWDNYEKCLTLARDRIGEKPLYYGWQGNTFLFGSELKSLREHPSFNGDMNWHAASSFLRFNFIPAPSTIYQGIHKLVPGTFLKLTQRDVQLRSIPSPEYYWSLGEVATSGLESPFTGSYADAVDELEVLVRQSVQLQSVADVPVGAFLSGGIDSSIVVAMMQLAASSKVTTFSIGMPDKNMDESKHAAAVAKHLATNHVEHIIQPAEALDLIPRLSDIWDEPFADSSQIPTYLVSQLAKKEVTVALTGDGGDEFFLGYSQYKLYQKIWRTKCFKNLPWGLAFSIASLLKKNQKVSSVLRHSQDVVNAWRNSDAQALARNWFDRYREGKVPLTEQRGIKMLDFPILADTSSTAALWDAGTYLTDNIMVKVDRAGMAHSLETRAPLLDHRIIEFSFRLPLEFKLSNGVGKRVLRDVLYRQVPRKIVDRPKMGFSIPLTAWLKKDLRPWAENLINQIPDDSEYFNKRMIDIMWRQHVTGKRNHTERLWGVLSLLSFYNKSF